VTTVARPVRAACRQYSSDVDSCRRSVVCFRRRPCPYPHRCRRRRPLPARRLPSPNFRRRGRSLQATSGQRRNRFPGVKPVRRGGRAGRRCRLGSDGVADYGDRRLYRVQTAETSTRKCDDERRESTCTVEAMFGRNIGMYPTRCRSLRLLHLGPHLGTVTVCQKRTQSFLLEWANPAPGQRRTDSEIFKTIH